MTSFLNFLGKFFTLGLSFVVFLFFLINFTGFFSFCTSPLVGFFFLVSNILVSAIMVILAKNPINALFFLISTFFNSSLLLIAVNIDFLAIIFVIVYIGAISVFFLFMIMMLNISGLESLRQQGKPGRLVLQSFFFIVSLLVSVYFLVNFLAFGFDKNLMLAQNLTSLKFNAFFLTGNVYEIIGHYMYTYYGVSLVLISIFLLVVMIGVIVLPVLVQKDSTTLKKGSSVFLRTF